VKPERSLGSDLGGSDLVLDGGLDRVCPSVTTRRTSRVTRVESMKFSILGNFRKFLVVIVIAAEEVRGRKT
jgi:hypothetical protein